MSEEDLERYEAEIELGLVQEYRAVLPVFSYVIETERRFYLANEVSLKVRSDTTPACIELELTRRLGLGHVPPGPLRPHGQRRHLPRREHRAPARTGALSSAWRRVSESRPFSGVDPPAAAFAAAEPSRWPLQPTAAFRPPIVASPWAGRARTGPPTGTSPAAIRSSSATGGARPARSTSSAPGATSSSSVRSRPGAPIALGGPAEAVTRTKQLRLRRLAAEYLSSHVCGPCDVRFDVVSILGNELSVIEAAF